MLIQFVSFGFKHELPDDLDLVIDVRDLRNPHRLKEFRYLTGLHPGVRRDVLSSPGVEKRMLSMRQQVSSLVDSSTKPVVRIGVGCFGGRHRSVVLASELQNHFHIAGYNAAVFHRDVNKTP